MSYIFISYSKKNQDYANKLAEQLLSEGFDVWIDARIDAGENWWNAIMKALRECDVFIVIMTPESENSDWVAREIAIADNLNKPVFPLLLEGSTNLVDSNRWSIYVLTQYEDVRESKSPSSAFYDRLEKFAKRDRHQSGQALVSEDHLQKISLDKTQLAQSITDKDLFPQISDVDEIITNYQLIFLYGMYSGDIFEIAKEIVNIGRDKGNDLFINHPEVSRYHCRLVYEENTYWIQDLDSTNGTFVNGRRILAEKPLKDRDYIRCGSYVTLRFRMPT